MRQMVPRKWCHNNLSSCIKMCFFLSLRLRLFPEHFWNMTTFQSAANEGLLETVAGSLVAVQLSWSVEHEWNRGVITSFHFNEVDTLCLNVTLNMHAIHSTQPGSERKEWGHVCVCDLCACICRLACMSCYCILWPLECPLLVFCQCLYSLPITAEGWISDRYRYEATLSLVCVFLFVPEPCKVHRPLWNPPYFIITFFLKFSVSLFLNSVFYNWSTFCHQKQCLVIW